MELTLQKLNFETVVPPLLTMVALLMVHIRLDKYLLSDFFITDIQQYHRNVPDRAADL